MNTFQDHCSALINFFRRPSVIGPFAAFGYGLLHHPPFQLKKKTSFLTCSHCGILVLVCGAPHPTGAISISITFFNKAVLSVYKFNFGNTLMLAQMIASLIFMHFMKKHGLIRYKDFDSRVAKQVRFQAFCVLSTCFIFCFF